MVNEWTREDLPTVNDLVEVSRESLFAGRTDGGVAVLDAVAAHLNAHHPKPEFEGYCTCNGYNSGGLMGDCGVALHRAQYRAGRVEADRDRWRRAHEIVEQERDQARASLHEACKVAQSYKVDAYQATERADQLRDERDDAVQSCITLGRALDEWKSRAEAEEARTAPAVTEADIEKVVRGQWGGCFDGLTDALWSLVSGSDPAVFVVRESDLPEVQQDEDGWTDSTRHGWEGTSETAMECVETHLEWARFYAAVARAIEAEQATDPVEDAAVAAFKAAWHRADEEGDEGNRVRRGIRAARDVLRQEASDGR